MATRGMLTCPQCRAKLAIAIQTVQSGGDTLSFEQSVKPLVDAPAPLAASPLLPGEERTSTHYHRWELADVMTDLAIAGISGVLIGLSSVPVCAAKGAEWYWPVGIWLGTTTVVWMVKAFDFFDNDKAVIKHEKIEHHTEPILPQIVAPSVELTFNERKEHGLKQERARLFAPQANGDGLARFCGALARDLAFPSWEGGQSKPGARKYGYTEVEFGDWRSEALRAKLLRKKPGLNQGYEVTERGKVAFERIGKQRLREASYGL